MHVRKRGPGRNRLDSENGSASATLERLAEIHPDVESVVSGPVTALGAAHLGGDRHGGGADAATANRVECDLYEQVLAAFGAAGISIPYPWSNVIVHEPNS